MFRSIPVSNKICFDKEVKRSWMIHEEKIRNLKSDISQTRPEKFQFLSQRPKKQALLELRNLEVDRENKILLQKINTISAKGRKPAIRVQVIDRKKTLNESYRKRELVKIVEQNQQILKRLQHKRSQYDIRKMERQRKEIEKNINLISEYGYKDYPVTHTQVNLWATTQGFCQPTRSRLKEGALTYKGYKRIDGNSYSVVSYVSKGQFFVELENFQDRKEKYRIELSESQAQNLLASSYSNSIANLIDNVTIDKEKQFCYLKYTQEASDK